MNGFLRTFVSCLALGTILTVAACESGQVTAKGRGKIGGADVSGGIDIEWGEKKLEAPANSTHKGTWGIDGKNCSVRVGADGTIWVQFPDGSWHQLTDGCITIRTPDGKAEKLCAGLVTDKPPPGGGGGPGGSLGSGVAIAGAAVAVSGVDEDFSVILGTGFAEFSTDGSSMTLQLSLPSDRHEFDPTNPDNGWDPLDVAFYISVDNGDGTRQVYLSGPPNEVAKYCVGQNISRVECPNAPLFNAIDLEAQFGVMIMHGWDGESTVVPITW